MDGGPSPSIRDFDLLVLLSGPEPQRTILEKMIIAQAAGCDCKMVLVRGLPGRERRSLAAARGGGPLMTRAGNVVIYDHLPAGELERLILRSEVVLSRPGYSTVMDLRRIGKKAIFVPTPGQTEQEYLGGYLAAKGLGICVRQHAFSLTAALMQARGLEDRPGAGNDQMKDEIRAMLEVAAGEK
jgi:predicted glycosyltransferase